MPDPLSINPLHNDVLAAPVAGPVRVAMSDVPPEVPPSGGFPPGKTPPNTFLNPIREPPSERGGAPAKPTEPMSLGTLAADRVAFERALVELAKMPGNVMKQIAGAYLGYSPRVGSKAQLIDMLRRRQRQDELNADRAKAQDKLRT